MEGYTVNGDYIGYSTLSKPATGLSVLQQPIREQYMKARKQGHTKKVVLRLVHTGLAISLVDTGGGQRGEMFYDINSISYIECVRFAVLSGNDKKVKAMFVSLGEQTLPSPKDKNAFLVDKSQHFMTQINHPPLLACVLRRPKGIKALDCHVFMLESHEDAFKIVSIIRQVQTRGSNSELMTEVKSNDSGSFKRGQNNDVIRTEYGEYSVYRGQQQAEVKDDYFRPQDGGGRENDEYNMGWSYRREQEPNDESWRNFDNAPRDRQDPRYAPQIRGSQGREYEQGTREYGGHGRQMSSDSAERMNMSFSDSSDRGGRYEEGVDRRSYTGGNISPRGSHAPPKVADKPHKPDPLLRPMGPPSPGQQSPTRAIESPRSPPYHSQQAYGRHSPPGRRFPSPTSPAGPVFSMSNLESRQDLPKHEDESHQGNKPIAKVPPHIVAGVKVLPTGFDPAALKLKPKAVKHDKSFGSGDSDPEYDNNVHVMNKQKKLPDYGYQSEKYIAERSAYNGGVLSDNYGRGGDNHDRGRDAHAREQHGRDGDGFGDGYGYNKEDVYDNYGKENGQLRSGYNNYVTDYERQHNDGNRQYIENYGDAYGVQMRESDQRNSGSNRYSVPSSAYDERSRDQGNRWSGSSGGQGRQQPSYDVGGRGRGAPPSGEGQIGKEAELASMFTNIHIRKGENTYTTSGNDFEDSLGYFP